MRGGILIAFQVHIIQITNYPMHYGTSITTMENYVMQDAQFQVFEQFKNYNNFKLHRRKTPTMTHDKLSEICTDLSQCLSFPSMLTIRHKNLAAHIDSLLTCLSKYKDRLSKDNIRHKTIYHKRMEPSVSVE